MTSRRSTILFWRHFWNVLPASPPTFAQQRKPQDEATVLCQRIEELYRTGRYSEAIPLAQRALAILEKAFGTATIPSVALSLNNLAALYGEQGRYADMLSRSTGARSPSRKKSAPTKSSGPSLLIQDSAALYKEQGRYADAEPLFRRAPPLRKKRSHQIIRTEPFMDNFAALYKNKVATPTPSRYSVARSPSREKALPPDHPT